jgi:hypothetical protein
MGWVWQVLLGERLRQDLNTNNIIVDCDHHGVLSR